MIIGDTSKDNDIIRKVREHGLENRVILKGAVHRDDVPELLCKSKILALARPNSLQSEGGFPTKLGEYLATGNLVVVTKVGDISRYLRDKESAIIAEPNSVVSFTACLDHAIVNYEKLTDVRLTGYEVCNRVFNSKLQGRYLEEYLSGLLNEI
jgi:glycosyltransferase involved in cell wall biosynthesis